MTELTWFKAYDIRGEIGMNIDEGIAYRVGRAVAQRFDAKSIVTGFDARAISPAFAAAASQGACEAGADAIYIGETDGVSLVFKDWRFNLRRSKTESLVRLNIESKRGASKLDAQVNAVAQLLDGTSA